MEWRGGRPEGSIVKSGKGFDVQFRNKNFPHSKYFSFSKCGGPEESQRLAEEYRLLKSDENGLTRNKWRSIEGGRIEMQLNHNKTTTFDEEYLPKLTQFTWYAHEDGNCWYAEAANPLRQKGGTSKLRMHALICPEYKIIDHIDGDSLNNIKNNLRDGSQGINENNRRLSKNNTSGENGISIYDDYISLSWRENGRSKFRRFSITKDTKQTVLKEVINLRDKIIYPRIKNNNGKRPRLV